MHALFFTSVLQHSFNILFLLGEHFFIKNCMRLFAIRLRCLFFGGWFSFFFVLTVMFICVFWLQQNLLLDNICYASIQHSEYMVFFIRLVAFTFHKCINIVVCTVLVPYPYYHSPWAIGKCSLRTHSHIGRGSLLNGLHLLNAHL